MISSVRRQDALNVLRKTMTGWGKRDCVTEMRLMNCKEKECRQIRYEKALTLEITNVGYDGRGRWQAANVDHNHKRNNDVS